MTCSLSALLAESDGRKIHKDGTHRLFRPEETLARVTPFLPVMGITRVANVTGLDTIGIPVVMVARPNSRSISVSQGKGVTLAAAKASGVMESIEGFHAERIEHPLKYGSYEDLRWSHRLVEPAELPRYEDGAYTPHTPLLWVEGDDLMASGEGAARAWVPFELAHLNYALPAPSGTGCFAASSNGLASGNSRLEAVCHALTEVIERDAATLWHLMDDEAQETTRIDPATVAAPLCRAMLDRFAAAGVGVGLWNLTSDLGIPAFLARIAPMEDAPAFTIRPASGLGCHPDRDIALSRALTEAAQSRLTFISGARDDMPRGEYLRHLDPISMTAWRERINLPGGLVSFADIETRDNDTLTADLTLLLDRLRAAGVISVIAIDLTKPMFGIPVVRVVVPGLEGMCDRPEYLLGRRARARRQEAAA